MSLLLDLFFPRACYLCGRSGFYLCPHCFHRLSFQPLKHHPRSSFDGILSIFNYEPPISSLIHDLKFGFVTDIIPDLAQAINWHLRHHYADLLAYWQQNHFVLVPIPLHSHRLRWRGFNQSLLLAQALSLPVADVLSRHRSTLPQSRLAQTQKRFQNLSSAFSLTVSNPPSNFILFDDVYTTGATLNSALLAFDRKYSLKPWALTLAGSHR